MKNTKTKTEELGRRHKPDHGLVVIALVLVALGLIVVQAISPALVAQASAKGKSYNETYFVMKQAIAIALGLAAFLVTSTIPASFWQRVKWYLVGLGALSSFVAIFVTKDVNGASRWIQLGGLSFQPAELVKFAIIIVVATYLSQYLSAHGSINEKAMKPFLIGLVITGLIVAGLQRDLGSTGVMVSIMSAMLFVSGAPFKRILAVFAIIIAGIVIAISVTPYRRDRLATFLNPGKDCNSTGYHACQALIAVGSGGIIGKKLGKSVQAYGYLPEAANDSIFAVFSETFGFVGSLLLLFLYGLLFVRILKIAQKSTSPYIRFLCVGVFAWFFTQTSINIGAMIGILPLKGITLPFISYGGTSIVFVMAGLGIVFQASRYTANRISVLEYSKANLGGGDYDGRTNNRTGGRGLGRSRYTVTRSR